MGDTISDPGRIAELQFDDANEAEMARHGVTAREVDQLLDDPELRVYRNKRQHPAQPYVLKGRTHGGRTLIVPIKPVHGGLWRPATAFDAPLSQKG